MQAKKPPLQVLEVKEWESFDPGLQRVHRVLSKIGDPHRQYPHILVGGTNGKSSVTSGIAANLPGRVGRFISPHLMDVRERITIDGRPVPDQEWRRAYRRIVEIDPAARLSYFEWLLLVAVIVFEQRNVDWAVFEVGLGGRLDATNALSPCLSVITNVSLDHCQLLGHDVQTIALEKIEIARRGQPLVLDEALLALNPVRNRIHELGPLIFPVGFEPTMISTDRNERIIRRVMDVLALPSPFRWVDVPGRREVLLGPSNHPVSLLDGAHNEAGWCDLASFLRRQSWTGFNLICSLSEGRNPRRFLQIMQPVTQRSYVWLAGFDRELPERSWRDLDVVFLQNPPAFTALEPLLVCGSLYLIGAYKSMTGDPDAGH